MGENGTPCETRWWSSTDPCPDEPGEHACLRDGDHDTAAHGDFHLANLCAPDLTILDWEDWGLAPPGYDAATLHSYSILTTETAAQVHHELGDMLTTVNGGYAELAVIAELLHAATEGTNPELVQPLLQRAASVKERLAS